MPQVKDERQVYGGRTDMLRAANVMKNRHARVALRIAIYSGMRTSEIKRTVPGGAVWILDDTKNGQPRHVPILRKAAVCARRFNRATPKITIQRCWERARDAAGLQGMHFHDWRHSAVSELINAGVDPYTVGRVLVHKDARSTQRYAHLAVGNLAAAADRIGQKTPHPTKRQGFDAQIKIASNPYWWRSRRDSNPRYGKPYTGFRVRRIRPLCHRS